ncbi:MAG: TonB-dependent receptor [Ignavibacteriaceae bacterium]
MIDKILFCVLLLISFAVTAFSQQAAITGYVYDEENIPLENVKVFINNSGHGAYTDTDGKFVLINIPGGTYSVTASFIGYETKTKTIEVKEELTYDLSFILKKKNIEINSVVVTGTRTNKNLLDSPVKTEVISSEDIRNSAFTRLDDILLEQPGLALINDHGKGIQMQGLDPAYTLILIDGEPVIGRTAGTIDLSRFSVSNLKQIEIVKGPSSSLYGSEALAGVINLITETPEMPHQFEIQTLYKTNNIIDLAGNASLSNENFTASLSVDRMSSSGYDLTPNTISQTAPEFNSYTISPSFSYKLSDTTIFKFNSRIFLEEQNNSVLISSGETQNLTDQDDKLTDWNNSLSFEHKISNKVKSEVKLYLSRYYTDSKLTYRSGGIYDQSSFDQYLYKGEIKNDFILNDKNYIIAGGGYLRESVKADRIADGEKINTSYFFFGQEEWIPNEIIDLVIGTRFDWHSEYSSRLSPKLSILIKPYKFLHLRGSFGSGFKAPTLQQLYLDFTNPQAGYSVFGSSNIKESFQKLRQEGQISRVLVDPSGIETIRAEYSLSYNLGLEFYPWPFLNASVNFFRNNVNDLIETVPIAVKTNGQSVFAYFNLNKIYTQGMETELKYSPADEILFSVSYQYLEAVDEDILQQVRNKEISKEGANGRIRPVQESEYGGLYNRSKHSGTIKIDYQNKDAGLTANLRGIVRGKYGFGDINGNGILDDYSEYVPGYAIWNFTITKNYLDHFTFLFGIENILDKTNAAFIPSLPGRIIYGGIQFSMF